MEGILLGNITEAAMFMEKGASKGFWREEEE